MATDLQISALPSCHMVTRQLCRLLQGPMPRVPPPRPSFYGGGGLDLALQSAGSCSRSQELLPATAPTWAPAGPECQRRHQASAKGQRLPWCLLASLGRGQGSRRRMDPPTPARRICAHAQCTHTHTYIYIYTHILYLCIYVRIIVCIYIYIYIHIHKIIYTYLPTYLHR